MEHQNKPSGYHNNQCTCNCHHNIPPDFNGNVPQNNPPVLPNEQPSQAQRTQIRVINQRDESIPKPNEKAYQEEVLDEDEEDIRIEMETDKIIKKLLSVKG